MTLNVSKILAALSAVALFAQTGVTQLDVSDTTKGFAVFGIGLVSVFLASITQPEAPKA